MINLTLPGAGCDYYVVLDNGLFGPFTTLGQFLTNVISYEHEDDRMSETKGWSGENSVFHLKHSGDVTYVPYDDITLAPTADYPDQIKFRYLYGTGALEKMVSCGLAYSGRAAVTFTSSITTNYAYSISEDGTLNVYRIAANRDPQYAGFISCYHTEYRLTKVQSGTAYYTKTQYNMASWSKKETQGSGWNVRRTFGEIVIAVNSNVSSVASTPVTFTSSMLRRATLLSFDPNVARLEADSVLHQLKVEKFPLPLTLYGDLAMQASQDVIANDTNMLAFIRDIRNPSEMIPKLKNLSSLKGLANNFLTIDYGLLPTFSDLTEIFGAFSRLKPHLDKFGYQTCDSSYQASNETPTRGYNLEQHIKLGLSDEDSGLLQLANGLERIGFFPTLTNLWDLIPYSFVLNWFISVGDLLERVDTRFRLMRYTIRYVTNSFKKKSRAYLAPSPDHPFGGSVELVQYSRWVTDQCPVPPLSLGLRDQDSSHWLEAFALLVQRRL